MEQSQHNFTELFRQLGLPSDKASIEAFIADHRGLPETTKISTAPFWTQSQRDFLLKAIQEDADWAPMVDQLNVELHESDTRLEASAMQPAITAPAAR
jgi:hypothetical protein